MLTRHRPIFFLSVLLIFLFYIMSSNDSHSTPIPVPTKPPRDFHYRYTVQKGVFLQSEDSTDDTTFDFVRFTGARRYIYCLTLHRKSRTSAS